MTKIKLIALGLCAAMTFSLFGCGGEEKVQSVQGEIDTSGEIATQETADEEVAEMPYYDYKNLPESNPLAEEEFSSYYARQLNEQSQIIYDEIYNAANEYQSEVALSKVIAVDTLKNIMNIIYLDTPELYMLDTKYSYDVNESGFVEKVYLYYAFTKETYESVHTSLLKTLTYNVSGLKKSDSQLDAEESIISRADSVQYTTEPFESKNFTGSNPQDSFYSVCTSNPKGSSLAIAKLVNYYCRKSGIDSAIVIGEITTTDFANNIGLNLKPYTGTNNMLTETVNGSHVDVVADYSGFYAWNIIELNDEWYHLDTIFPRLWKSSESTLKSIDVESMRTTGNVNDYTISQSRLFYVNEDVLGLIPECTGKNFQFLYRSGNYILDYNSNQIVIAITQKLDDLIKNKSTIKLYQFGSEDTYNLFVNNFDKTVNTYNQNNGNAIQNYRILENKETLTIVICDLIYYQ